MENLHNIINGLIITAIKEYNKNSDLAIDALILTGKIMFNKEDEKDLFADDLYKKVYEILGENIDLDLEFYYNDDGTGYEDLKWNIKNFNKEKLIKKINELKENNPEKLLKIIG